jgi:hypothetical protein
VDKQTNAENCGECDNRCADGAACEGGTCVCPAGGVCGELLCEQITSDPFTILALSDGYLLGSRYNQLTARPIDAACSGKSLVATKRVDEIVPDGETIYVLARIEVGGTNSKGIVGRTSLVVANYPNPPFIVAECPGCNFANLVVRSDRAYFLYDHRPSVVLSVPTSATDATPETIGGLTCDAIAAGPDYLYCANDGLYRVSYDGTDVTELVAAGTVATKTLIIADGFLYWLDTNADTIERVALAEKHSIAPGKVWVRRKRRRQAETSRGTLWVISPTQPRLTTSWKRALGGRTTARAGRKVAKRR